MVAALPAVFACLAGLRRDAMTGGVTNPEVNGVVYSGIAEMQFKQSSAVVPVLSLGYAKSFRNGLGVVAEVEATIGTYSLTAPSDFLPLADRADFDANLMAANDDLQDIAAIPFITLGLSYRF